MHNSAITCKPEVIKFLIGAGADVNAKTHENNMSMTPLHWFANMASCGDEAIEILLDSGADATIENAQGKTAL